MRGFTITVRQKGLMKKLFGPVQLKAIGGSMRDAAPSFSSRSPYSSYHCDIVRPPSSGVLSSTGPTEDFDIPDYQVGMIFEMFFFFLLTTSLVSQIRTPIPCYKIT